MDNEQKAVIDRALNAIADLRDHLTSQVKTASASTVEVDPERVLDFAKGVILWG